MKKEPNTTEKFSLRNRFNYWFDNKMTKGSLGLIRVLIAASVMLAVLIAGLIILFGFNEDGENAAVFWDSIATVINAWMPSFADGSMGYLFMMSIVAIAGVLFTSVLIGIITNAIEEKIDNLKRGNSIVLEKDHIVILGLYPGEYTLIQQLILAAAGKPTCIVVAENMDRQEMEESISENLDVPENFRIVCRTVDITDPASIEKCSVETCKTVIVSPTNDMRTIKAVLAVSTLLEEKGVPEISVNAIIAKNEHKFPQSIAEANNILTLQTNNILAKMIAHSCTPNGLSETFREVFNFEGSEFYLTELSGIHGLDFATLMDITDNAVPVGVYRNGEIILNPSKSFLLQENDRVLVFSEERNSARRVIPSHDFLPKIETNLLSKKDDTDTVIIGHNETLPLILNELPENVANVYLVGQQSTESEKNVLARIAAKKDLNLTYYQGNPRSEEVLIELANIAEHIVILNDHDKDAEEADMAVIFLLLNLRDIRKRFGLQFNITVEMRREHNQKLVGVGDHTDFLVASSTSSLILAQLAESPELIDVFQEILSTQGNELYIKSVAQAKLEGKHKIRTLRQVLLQQGYILLGYLDAEKESHFNPPINKTIELTAEDALIVLGSK